MHSRPADSCLSRIARDWPWASISLVTASTPTRRPARLITPSNARRSRVSELTGTSVRQIHPSPVADRDLEQAKLAGVTQWRPTRERTNRDVETDNGSPAHHGGEGWPPAANLPRRKERAGYSHGLGNRRLRESGLKPRTAQLRGQLSQHAPRSEAGLGDPGLLRGHPSSFACWQLLPRYRRLWPRGPARHRGTAAPRGSGDVTSRATEQRAAASRGKRRPSGTRREGAGRHSRSPGRQGPRAYVPSSSRYTWSRNRDSSNSGAFLIWSFVRLNQIRRSCPRRSG